MWKTSKLVRSIGGGWAARSKNCLNSFQLPHSLASFIRLVMVKEVTTDTTTNSRMHITIGEVILGRTCSSSRSGKWRRAKGTDGEIETWRSSRYAGNITILCSVEQIAGMCSSSGMTAQSFNLPYRNFSYFPPLIYPLKFHWPTYARSAF